MLTTLPRPTAQIIPFPARAPTGASDRHDRFGFSALDLEILDQPIVNYDSWYHDDAIRDARVPGKR